MAKAVLSATFGPSRASISVVKLLFGSPLIMIVTFINMMVGINPNGQNRNLFFVQLIIIIIVIIVYATSLRWTYSYEMIFVA